MKRPKDKHAQPTGPATGETFTTGGRALPDTPPPPVIVAGVDVAADMPPGEVPTTTAERVAAYHAAHSWQGAALRPFSWKRRALFDRLRVFVAMVALELPRAYDSRFAFEAGLVLWLCSTEDKELADMQHDAQAMLAAVDAWAEENIITAAERAAAGPLAWFILWEPEKTLAVPRPEKPGREGPGNSLAR